MPSEIGQFSSQLTSGGIMEMEQLEKDRNLSWSFLSCMCYVPSFHSTGSQDSLGQSYKGVWSELVVREEGVGWGSSVHAQSLDLGV